MMSFSKENSMALNHLKLRFFKHRVIYTILNTCWLIIFVSGWKGNRDTIILATCLLLEHCSYSWLSLTWYCKFKCLEQLEREKKSEIEAWVPYRPRHVNWRQKRRWIEQKNSYRNEHETKWNIKISGRRKRNHKSYALSAGEEIFPWLRDAHYSQGYVSLSVWISNLWCVSVWLGEKAG